MLTAASLATGFVATKVRRQAMAVAEIEGRGGAVVHHWRHGAVVDPFDAGFLLAAARGESYRGRPMAVVFPPRMRVTDEDLRLVSLLGSVEAVHLAGFDARPAVTNRGLAHLERMPNLKQLRLHQTAVTSIAMKEFRRRRPDCCLVGEASVRLALHQW